MSEHRYIRWFEEIQSADLPSVGGKNASLGELTRALGTAGVQVPGGFAVTTDGYCVLLSTHGLAAAVDLALERMRRGDATLAATGQAIRERFLAAELPDGLAEAVRGAYRELCRRSGQPLVDVAVRSSATVEDLPGASFAGQQESYLHIRGEEALLAACRRCYASLFTDRAISYRERMGFDQSRVALSIGVQTMVRSDLAGSGVIFTLDTESGFPGAVLISAAWGLGEAVVQGTVSPDQYTLCKPLLDRPGVRPILDRRCGGKATKLVYAEGEPAESPAGRTTTVYVPTGLAERAKLVLADDEILRLGRWAVAIERHYGVAMDIEWAKDGASGELFIVQARPETVQSRRPAAVRTYRLAKAGEPLLTGVAVGDAVVSGRVRRLDNPTQADQVEPGDVLVTRMTDPDWGPVLKAVAGIVTGLGGRTCHAAIVARELGIPAVVGAGDGYGLLADGQEVTLSCAEGEIGRVYAGRVHFEVEETDFASLPATRTRVLVNLADPSSAFSWWRSAQEGIGLARMEFIVANLIRVHPMALAHPEKVADERERAAIAELTRGYGAPADYFVDRLACGVATLAASCYPAPCIVRLSDFKTNEYAALLGGRAFEPAEENPMLGWRGASRYASPGYRDGFALECRALRRVREEIGLSNVVVMVPFCRTPEEADQVLAAMAENGLERGRDGLAVYVMCEVPSNVVLADRFAARFDGFSIGSNDLTQLVLGVDRDSAQLAYLFDERDEAVTILIRQAIAACHTAGIPIGICGQAPSDRPEMLEMLVAAGIDSISVDPGRAVAVRRRVAACETAGRAPVAEPAPAALAGRPF